MDIPEENWLLANDFAFVIEDKFPVTDGHALVVTRRIVPDWNGASREEKVAVMALVEEVMALLNERLHPDGFNVGFNIGDAAGQTVPHLHVHVIPRYAGDVADPTGGVRAVIPEKANYLASRPPGGF